MSGVAELTVEQLQDYRMFNKEKIDLADALHRLHNNTDFQSVFLKDYMEKEPARLVMLLGDPTFNLDGKKNEHRADLQEKMIGISRFSEYVRRTFMLADIAQKNLEGLKEAETEFYKGN